MKVFIKNKGSRTLTQKQYLAQGGEGTIYVVGNEVYKIYHDPNKMIPTGKIQELSVINDDNVIKPEDILLDQQNNVVGYTMKYVQDTYALCQLFTKAFRERNKLTPDMMLDLVRKLQDIVNNIHKHHILVVDLNEMNFLAAKDFDQIFAIDVDSYQTPHYPATAIMDSIKDRHSKTFSELTDWFSFGVVAFQMLTGLHPYKGKHPTIKNWNDRMEKNISVFNKEVSIPSVCYPFSVIPKIYLDWFKAVFEDGKRMLPPADLQAVSNIITTINKIVGSNNFDINEIAAFVDNIIKVKYFGSRITITNSGVYDGNRKLCDSKPNMKVIKTPKMGNVICANIEYGKLKLYDATYKKDIPVSIYASDIMECNGRLYIRSIASVLETQFSELGNNIIASFKIVGNISEHATDFFDGVVFQNLLGAYHISLFPNSGMCYQVRIKEIDNYKIIDAKFDNGILMIVGVKNGKYDKFILRFDHTYSQYDIRSIVDISYSGLNFVCTDAGICVHLNENEEVEIFSSTKNSASIKIIDDDVIDSNMTLCKNGSKIEFYSGDKLYSFAMKK